MIKNYFRYLCKQKLSATLFIFLIFFLFSTLPVLSSKRPYSLNTVTFLVLMFSYVIPLFNTSILHKKKSTDLYFSLPISKRSLWIIYAVFGYLQLFCCYTITYLLQILLVHSLYKEPLEWICFIYYYGLMILISLVIYLFSFFVCLRSTSTSRAGVAMIQLVMTSFLFPFHFTLLVPFASETIYLHSNILLSTSYFISYLNNQLIHAQYITELYPAWYVTLIVIFLCILLFSYLIYHFSASYQVENVEKGDETMANSLLHDVPSALLISMLLSLQISLQSSFFIILSIAVSALYYFVFYFICIGRLRFTKRLLLNFVITFSIGILSGIIANVLIH